MYPEICQRVYDEISEHYQTGSYLDYDTVQKMTYLDMVIKEVLRLFPVAPLSIRDSLDEEFIGKVFLYCDVNFFL